MKKFKIGEQSEIQIPKNIDIFFAMRSVAFAQLMGLKKASISVAIKEGRIIADEKKQIRLVDNIDYIVGRLKEEIIRMSEEQRNNVTTLINRITEARKELYKKGELIYPGQARTVQLQQQQKAKAQKPAGLKRLDKIKKLKMDIIYTAYLLDDEIQEYTPLCEVAIFPKTSDSADDLKIISFTGIDPGAGVEVFEDDTLIFHFQGEAFSNKEIFLKEESYFS